MRLFGDNPIHVMAAAAPLLLLLQVRLLCGRGSYPRHTNSNSKTRRHASIFALFRHETSPLANRIFRHTKPRNISGGPLEVLGPR